MKAIALGLLVVALGTAGLWRCAASREREPVAAPCDLGPVTGFVENRGQWPADVAFAASARGEWVRVTGGALEFGCGRARFVCAPVAAVGALATGRSPTGALCNFLFGADPAAHVRGARVFHAVEQAVAPGVDLVLRRAAPGQAAAFAYDLRFVRGARAADVEFVVAGARSLRIDANGELVLESAHGELRQSAPVAWVQDGERRSPVDCCFELRGADRFGFRAELGSAPTELCIDPDLRWSTCLGGGAIDNGFAIAVAPNGDVFLAGTTQSTNLPVTPAAFDPSYNGSVPQPFVVGDGFVARLAAGDGSLLWCTYLGGNENDQMVMARAIGNEVVVTGWTSSTDFPTTPGAFDTTHNGTGDGYQYTGGDVFVTRLAANGQSLVWSSFLGGAMLEYPSSLAVADNGEVAVAGHVHSTNFPTTPGCWSSTRNAFSDFFVTRFAANGQSLVGSTYCGGSDGEEYVFALAIAPDGDIIAAGATDSTDLPVTAGAYDLTYNGGTDHFADGFVARFDRTASILRWCTYLGTPSNEYPRGIALHFDGSITLTGTIDGPGLPTSPAVFGPAPFGARDGFAWRLSGNGSTSLWATYVGGGADDFFERAIPVGGGRVAVCGQSFSANPPLSRGAWNPAPLGGGDGWLCILSSNGSAVDYGTAIGAPFSDYAFDVSRTPAGELVASGTTWSWQFPVTTGVTNVGFGDAWCVQVAGLPTGVQRRGAPSGLCARGARVHVRSGPFVGEANFALTAGDVPPGSPAVAAVSFAALATSQPLFGVDLWVDLATMLATPSAVVDGSACAHLPLPIPASQSFVGLPLAVQFLWIDSCGGVSIGASDAVAIVIQP